MAGSPITEDKTTRSGDAPDSNERISGRPSCEKREKQRRAPMRMKRKCGGARRDFILIMIDHGRDSTNHTRRRRWRLGALLLFFHCLPYLTLAPAGGALIGRTGPPAAGQPRQPAPASDSGCGARIIHSPMHYSCEGDRGRLCNTGYCGSRSRRTI